MFKYSLKIFLRYALSVFMSFFIAFSCTLIFNFLFSKETGYDVFAFNEETGKNEFLYSYINSEGEDEKYALYEAEYGTLTKTSTRELPKSYLDMSNVISSVLSIVFVTGALYSYVWNIGNHDIKQVKTGAVAQNKFRGICAGMIADIPSVALYITLWLCRAEILTPKFLSVFRIFNLHIYGYISIVYGNAADASYLTGLQMLLLSVSVLFLPLICAVAYYTGYKDIRINEKIVYKKENKES